MVEATPLHEGDPKELSGYRLEGRLGEGAQGVVFLGRDQAGGPVAVKVLHARLAGDAQARRRLVQELAATKQVAGFGTAQVLDADVSGDRPYVVSEYVAGPSLQKLVAEQGPRTGGALERLAVGTAMALAAIHRAGVVHRDVKPGNVLLGPDGPRVIDFGVARALESTATLTVGAVGTPSYMAPEQLGQGEIGPAADVFAWACTMLYAATGAPPFGKDTVAAVMTRVLTAEPDLSGVPAPFAGVLVGCLAKDPAARPGFRQVMDQLVGDLGDGTVAAAHPVADPTATVHDTGRPAASFTPAPTAAAGASAATLTHLPPPGSTPASGPTAPAAPPLKDTRPRRRRRVLVAAAAVLALLAGGGVWWLVDGRSGPQRYTSLTRSGCRMVPAATVRALVPKPSVVYGADGPEQKAASFRTDCSWDTHDESTVFTQLRVSVAVELNVPDPDLANGDATDGLKRAEEGIGSDRTGMRSKANRTKRLGTGKTAYVEYFGPVVELHGLGDEAVSLAHHERANDGTSYDPEVVDITVRLVNAEISVEYYSGDNRSKPMIPTSESVTRKKAETVARDLVQSLKSCKECRG